ncbi:DUF4145 domain-containing protein [Psychrobacter sp. JB385]|uniref:DUF4145 domain-containing protein n=1 Tax=Psychrobacter sp. JB385 TaxID=1434841 RepID=UPI00097EF661|nr:DUF4145 domain-containing protein [Psychrobacter sp. JB385]SJN40122.1 hypothetical protein CZ794_11165 [Psychrobacter sp. JB385]
MERYLYTDTFTEEEAPDYLCPRCNKGLLRLNKDTLKSVETVDSKLYQRKEYSEFQDMQMIFNCMFKCINDKCGEVVACTGHAGVGIERAVDYDNFSQPDEYYTYYKPLFFYPNLNLITIPKDTPDDIKKLLNKSFELFFTAPSAAANLVRVSIEEILTDQGVEKINNLHRRIEKLPEKHESLKTKFFALKWLGNAGSHSGDRITADDAMDAYELVEDLLLKIYSSKDNELNMLANKINTLKGPKK